jgi:membrane associated rhomboid family serine protease
MHSQTEPWVDVATRLDERSYVELSLVLVARGVEHRGTRSTEGWRLSVPAADAQSASAEITAYQAENSPHLRQRRGVAEIGRGGVGVAVYAAVLLVVFVCVRRIAFGFDWLAAGRLEAGRVVAGEWWRAVTALSLHLDVDHLASNLAFGAFFGYFVGRYLGAGLGWLAILGAGALGNVLNAWVQSPEHRAIGASTAVFAALGLLSAYTWRRGLLQRMTWRARVAPIVAGIALLAFTGTGGENTDIFAHLTGFIAGFGTGAALAAVEIPRSPRLQWVCAALAAAAVVGAWASALAAAS